MRGEDVAVFGVEHHSLDRLPEHQFGVLGDIRVKWVIACHEQGEGGFTAAASAADLLPK